MFDDLFDFSQGAADDDESTQDSGISGQLDMQDSMIESYDGMLSPYENLDDSLEMDNSGSVNLVDDYTVDTADDPSAAGDFTAAGDDTNDTEEEGGFIENIIEQITTNPIEGMGGAAGGGFIETVIQEIVGDDPAAEESVGDIPEDDGYFDEETGIWYPPTFDPARTDGEGIIGEPAEDMDNWHQQTYDDTCAVVSQEFILNELVGEYFTEDQLRQEALEYGWYTPGGGTPLECMGNLLEAHGLQVEREFGMTLDDLAQSLENGEKVMVGIDADEIWDPGFNLDQALNDYAFIPDTDANHAVEVIGIDNSNPDNPQVILNDPGHPGGEGMLVPAENFMDAWEDSDCFMVTASNPFA